MSWCCDAFLLNTSSDCSSSICVLNVLRVVSHNSPETAYFFQKNTVWEPTASENVNAERGTWKHSLNLGFEFCFSLENTTCFVYFTSSNFDFLSVNMHNHEEFGIVLGINL